MNNLQKTTTKRLKRVGRGHGSGRGKTAGRGMKGQKARTKVPLFFEGGALPLIKRLPYRRGRGKNISLKPVPIVVNIKALNFLPAKSVVDLDTLVKHNIVSLPDAKKFGIKILGDGEVKLQLTVRLPISNSAKSKIEKAGGKVESS